MTTRAGDVRDIFIKVGMLPDGRRSIASFMDITFLKKTAAAFFDSFVDLTVKNLKKGNKVRITGLGILAVRKRAARMGRNPATGEAIKIKASKKVAFRVAKDLKEAI